METLLIHEDLMNGSFFADICNMFKREGVKLNSGPKLNQMVSISCCFVVKQNVLFS